VLSTITSEGGGLGASTGGTSGNGGSGGGRPWTGTRGLGTANQGYDGGNYNSGGAGAGGVLSTISNAAQTAEQWASSATTFISGQLNNLGVPTDTSGTAVGTGVGLPGK
jgi:hypothetical protein